MHKKWFLVSADFKPMTGGVAEFSFQIASILQKEGVLKSVITPIIQIEPSKLPIISPNKKHFKSIKFPIKFLQSKIKSLLYRLFYLRCIFLILSNRDKIFFFSYVDDLYARPLIKICHYLQVEFIVLLHGKDIIRIAEEKKSFLDYLAVKSKYIIFNSFATATLFKKYANTPVIETRHCIWYPGGRFDYLDELETRPIQSLDKLPSNARIISSVCRLVDRKGIHLAIQAFQDLLLNSDYQDVYYVIAGDGSERQKLESLARHNPNILFLGNVTEEQKKYLLKRSCVFIMPNHSVNDTDFEGFGISFIEASYFNNIVIGGESGGAIEAVQLCSQGILVNTNSEKSISFISNAISQALSISENNKSINLGNIELNRKILREKINLELNILQTFKKLGYGS